MGTENFSLSQIYIMDSSGDKQIELKYDDMDLGLSIREDEIEHEIGEFIKDTSITFKLSEESNLKLMKMVCKSDPFISEDYKRRYKYLKRCYNRKLLYRKMR